MQTFKSISFADRNGSKSKIVPISFTEKEQQLFSVTQKLSSQEIRNIIGYTDYSDLVKAAEDDKRSVSQLIKFLLEKAINNNKEIIAASDVTFKNSKQVPFNRWYPYIEGYSPDFVKTLIRKYLKDKCIIYEPFAGTGTTLFAADEMGFGTYYSEINPLLQLLIQTKMKILKKTQEEWNIIVKNINGLRRELFSFTFPKSRSLDKAYHKVFKDSIYFPKGNYDKILRTKSFIDSLSDSIEKDIINIAVVACLIPSSYLKKQGDLRFKTKKELQKGIADFSDLLNKKIEDICEDLALSPYETIQQEHKFIIANAKKIADTSCDNIGCILTSPPYLNGTNYIRNTKLELWFLGHIISEKDLRDLRDEILTSGINDVKLTSCLDVNINSKSQLLAETLKKLKETAYDVRIPYMAECYFSEMYQIFSGLKDKLESNATLLIDIGDSVFNGVHVHTDSILIEILESIGYYLVETVKLRERRSRGGKVVAQVLIVMKNQ